MIGYQHLKDGGFFFLRKKSPTVKHSYLKINRRKTAAKLPVLKPTFSD